MPKSTAKPPIEVLVGPAHSAKTERVIRAFRESLERGEDAVVILPTYEAATSLRTELLLDKTFDFFGGPRILTFIQFAEQVLQRHAPEVQPIDAMVEDEVLSRIIAGLAKEGRIAYHAGVLDFRGFVSAVRTFIMELKRAEITPADFERFTARQGATQKDIELGAIYSRYQETLKRLNLYDEEGRFWRAKSLVSEGKLGPFAHLRRVFLDGFYDFTPTQLGLVEELGRRGVQLTMTLPLEEDAARGELFESAEATLRTLRRRFTPTLQPMAAKEVTELALGWLADNLFRTSVPEGAPIPDSISLIETPGAPVEVREIAREIKRLHLDEGVPLEKIAVLFRTLTDYRDIVEEVFEEFGIPARIGRGIRLILTPVGQLMLHILRVPAEGWRSRDVMSLLKSNYVSPAVLGLDGALSVSRFEELVMEAGVIRGRASWVRDVKALRERTAARVESPGAESDEEVRRRVDPEELKAKVADLKLVEEACGTMFELFAPLERATTVAEVVAALREAAARLGVEENILKAPRQELAVRDLEGLSAVNECLDALVRTASIVGESASGLADVARNLALAFADRSIAQHGADFGRVHVSEVHDVRALSFDVVFIGGLLERSFPHMHREDPFYDDRRRKGMTEDGLDLQPRRLSQREERFLFYLAVTRAKKRLYLSYPVTDREGKEKLVSYYVGEVKRAFALHEISCRKVTLSTKVAGIDASASRPELRRAAVLRLSVPRLSEPMLLARVSAYLWRAEGSSALVLKRGLEGEAERDSWNYFGVHDGVLAHPAAIASLSARFGAKHDFSVTNLEGYGCCPFSFFCSSVLRVEAPAEPPEELEAVDEGVILHRTLRQFYAERLKEKGDARIGADEEERAASRIREIADGHLDRFRRQNPDMNEGLFRLQREKIREVLSDFVRAEIAQALGDELKMSPRYFEAAFGLPVNPATADAISSPDRLILKVKGADPVSLVGKIDRIDVGDSPDGGKGRAFRVIDYKRSEPPSGTSGIEDGTSLQMPVYAMAAEQVLLRGKHMQAVDAQFYGLRKMRIKTAMSRVKPPRGALEWDECMRLARRFIRAHVRDIRGGQFPVIVRGKNPCPGYCEVSDICRYTEWRAVKKLGKFKPWFAPQGTDDDE